MDEMKLLQPSSNVQISKKTPMKFLKRACEISRKGWGQPAFYNTEAIIQELMNAGKSLEDARKGGTSGCVETGAFGNEAYILTGYFNIPKIFELTLNNGYDKMSGQQLGLELGYATDFETYEDLFEAFNQHEGDERIPAIIKEMEEELGAGNKKPEILSKLAQYELTLKDWIRDHKGYRKYVTIAGKCWPAFQTQFGFVPCYVNSRLAAQGIPVSCEVDIYGALSEFIGTVVSQDAVTLLDINNSVPADMYNEEIKDNYDYTQKDTFMGFHCGNTAKSKLSFCEMKYQKIMARTLPEEVTQGTLEGDIVPGDITFFRLQSTADTKLRAYVAQGEILPVATRSFGSIGVFAIPEMGRFYRHVLIEKNFPHHGAVAFGHFGKTLYEVFKYIGVDVDEIGFNQPKNMLYKTENPFS